MNTTTNNDGERAWRMALKVGDEIAMINKETNGGISYSMDTVHDHTGYEGAGREFTNADIICTSLEAFSRETGHYPDGGGMTRIVFPSAEIREQIELSTQLQEDWDFRGEPLSRLRAIAWILDIDHGPAPGFEAGDIDQGERADMLEAINAGVRFDNPSVSALTGSIRTLRQAAASVVSKDGPGELFAVGLGSIADIPIGNGPEAESLAHLVAYALRSLPDYIRLLREEQRKNAIIDRLLSVNRRISGQFVEGRLSDEEPTVTEIARYGDDVDTSRGLYGDVEGDTGRAWEKMWDQLPDVIGVLCERLGGQIVVTDAQRQEALSNADMTISRYSDRIIVRVEGGK